MSPYRQEAVERLPGVRKIVLEHLQNINYRHGNMDNGGVTISGGKSIRSRTSVKLDMGVCGEARKWLQASRDMKG